MYRKTDTAITRTEGAEKHCAIQIGFTFPQRSKLLRKKPL